MPVTFTVRPALGLVCARFTGHILVEDCLSSLRAFAAHPDFRPTLHQLIDLSGVTGFERDFVRILAFFAQMPDAGFAPGQEFLVVYHAPSTIAQELARIVMRSWEGLDGPVLRIVTDAAQAMSILGLAHLALADLGATAD